ncbi:MAG: tRNA lysidine(34) synthetase TilS [Sandaracinaceae bacterium]|nr:tRNA lysidine(34) synthetase TilS [Sandaracinaceae bacterium]
MLNRVRHALRERCGVCPGDRILVAVSGGPDSMALFHALFRLRHTLGFEIEAATVDHGLRPTSAKEHEAVAEHIRSHGIRCAVLSLGLKDGPALQERARKARYQALFEEAQRVKASHVAVGHTLDDQAETVLARLLRGSGIRGLAAILEHREDGLIRPLLGCTRAEILEFLEGEGIKALVFDPSNSFERFQRARIRKELLPAFAKEEPRINVHLARLAEEARELNLWIEQQASSLPLDMEQSALVELPNPLRVAWLRRWATHHGIPHLGRAHLDALNHLLRSKRGVVWLPGNRSACLKGERLELLQKDAAGDPNPQIDDTA